MKRQDNRQLYDELRRKYPVFVFEDFSYKHGRDSLKVVYNFHLQGKCVFRPEMEIPYRSFMNFELIDKPALESLLFHIGMVELVSYWKAACSPEVVIKPYGMGEEQLAWFRKLYFKGLGEFRYLNGLEAGLEHFVTIIPEGKESLHPFSLSLQDQFLVPLGGGKDSAVTLEILRQRRSVRPFAINPTRAATQTALQAGFETDEIAVVARSIDPRLLQLNEEGFLNGHTPFSALIAFTSLLCAGLSGIRNIALSNEASANEATIAGTDINHQYSKTFEFESDFREYYTRFICGDFNYFSFLRPLQEIQIAKIFSGLPQYFDMFRSCNAGSKSGQWCGNCAKCLFTCIILAPFLTPEERTRIFGQDLLDRYDLKSDFDGLAGLAGNKPFDCVGTLDEVNAALCAAIQQYSTRQLPALLDYYLREKKSPEYVDCDLSGLLKRLNEKHFLDAGLLELLIQRL